MSSSKKSLTNLTIDSTQLMDVPLQQRVQLAKSPASSEIFGNMSPSEIAALFPKYYRERLTNSSGQIDYSRATSGGGYNAPGRSSSSGGTATQAPAKPPTPKSASDKILADYRDEKLANIPTPAGMNTRQSVMFGLIKRGFSKEEAAAVVGNIAAESGFKTAIQDYKGSGHFGLMQWGGDRLAGLQKYAADKKIDWTSLEAQIDWIALERSGDSVNYGGSNEKPGYDKAFASGDVSQMALGVGQHVERPSNAELNSSADNRMNEAMTSYNDPVIESLTNAESTSPAEPTPPTGTDTGVSSLPTDDSATVTPEPFVFDVSKLSPGLQTEYNNAGAEKQAVLREAITAMGYEKVNKYVADNPTASPSTVVQKIEDEASRVSENQQGFRSSPLKPEFKNDLEYAAAQTGLYVKVFSGGQTEEQQAAMIASGRASSNRHDIEHPDTPGAADVKLAYKDESGREVILDQRNPEHHQLIKDFVKNVARVVPSAGIGGWAPNDNYMGPTSIHVGGGNYEGAPPIVYKGQQFLHDALNEGLAQRAEDQKNGSNPVNAWMEERQKALEASTATVTPPEEAPGTAPVAPTQVNTAPGTAASPPTDTAVTPGSSLPTDSPTASPAPEHNGATPGPAPVENSATAPSEPPPVPQLSTGGVVPNSAQEPLSVVNNATGETLANVQPNEKLTTTPNGLKVDSAAQQVADQQVEQNSVGNPTQQPNRPTPGESVGGMVGRTVSDPAKSVDILTDLANMTTVYSPSQARAMAQATLGGVYGHYSKGTNIG